MYPYGHLLFYHTIILLAPEGTFLHVVSSNSLPLPHIFPHFPPTGSPAISHSLHIPAQFPCSMVAVWSLSLPFTSDSPLMRCQNGCWEMCCRIWRRNTDFMTSWLIATVCSCQWIQMLDGYRNRLFYTLIFKSSLPWAKKAVASRWLDLWQVYREMLAFGFLTRPLVGKPEAKIGSRMSSLGAGERYWKPSWPWKNCLFSFMSL